MTFETKAAPASQGVRRTLGAALALGAALLVTSASAQQQTRLGAFKDWSAFKTETQNGVVCWAATAPTDSKYSQTVSNRGDAYLMVSFRPSQGVDGEVSVISGFPYDSGRGATATIGSRAFSLFTQEDGAWLETRKDDSDMVNAMKAGANAVVAGYSQRGTKVTDTFSLIGFTASYNSARKACQ